MPTVNELTSYLRVPVVVNDTLQMHPQWQRFFTDFISTQSDVPATAGIYVYTGSGTISRSIVSGSSKVNITNGTGVSGNITVDVDQGEIDHDSLSGFVADEHIDWTGASTAFSTTANATVGSLTVNGTTIIENGEAPVLNVAGEIAIDTVVLNYTGMITYYDGTEALFALGIPTGNLSSTDDDTVYYDSANNELAMGPRGRVVQVVHTSDSAVATGSTTVPNDDTIPQNTEGDEYMTLSITPKDTTNRLLIEAELQLASSAAVMAIAALFQDSTADALAAGMTAVTTADDPFRMIIRHEMAAGTTSSTTFKVRVGPDSAATITFNGISGSRKFGGVSASSMRITEVLA